jgi:hypothetical protein
MNMFEFGTGCDMRRLHLQAEIDILAYVRRGPQ